MKLLALDTSTEIASVALLVEKNFFCEEQAAQKTHAQWILPIIDRVMNEAALSMNQLDGIVFGCGPGSFTGLRIACSIAKGLAYAHDLDLIPVSSLATIAWSVRQIEGNVPVLSVLDARMQELYWSYLDSNTLIAQDRVSPAHEIDIPLDKSFILAGLGVDDYRAALPKAIQSQIFKSLHIYPTAQAMLGLALEAKIKPVSFAQAQPSYVRNQVTQGGIGG